MWCSTIRIPGTHAPTPSTAPARRQSDRLGPSTPPWHQIRYQGHILANTLSYRHLGDPDETCPRATPPRLHMTGPNLSWNANYLWGIADDLSPRILLRRLNAVLEPTKQGGPRREGHAGRQRGHDQDAVLRKVPGQAFDSASTHTLRDCGGGAGRQLLADAVDHIGGFSPNVQDILDEKITTPRPALGPRPISRWTASRFVVGIPLTCDRCVL